MSDIDGYMTDQEMYELAHSEYKPFILDDLLCESVTLWYGQSEIGKSRLVVGLVAALLRGETFLDRKPQQNVNRIVILTADSGGKQQYSRRLFLDQDDKGNRWSGLTPSETGGRLWLRRIATMTPDRWVNLKVDMDRIEPDLLIIDPLSRSANGDTSNPTVADEYYEGLDLINRPSLIIGHSSIKPDEYGKKRGSQTPIGHTNWVNHCRWRVEILADGSGQIGELKASGNDADKVEMRLQRLERMSEFSVSSETVRSERVDVFSAEAKRQANWVIANCAHISQRRSAGKALVTEFNLAEGDARRMDSDRAVGELVEHDGSVWRWR